MAALPFDQRKHRLARPEREGQLQLVWASVCDQLADPSVFSLEQLRLLARPVAAPTAFKGGIAPLIARFQPFGNETPIDANRLGRRKPRHATINHGNRPTSQRSLH